MDFRQALYLDVNNNIDSHRPASLKHRVQTFASFSSLAHPTLDDFIN